MATAGEFKQFFPQFCDLATDSITVWLNQAPLDLCVAAFGAQWNMAAILYAAHKLVTLGAATPAHALHQARGPVKSEKVMDLTQSFGDTVKIDQVDPGLQQYLGSSYGIALIGLIESLPSTGAMAIQTATSC